MSVQAVRDRLLERLGTAADGEVLVYRTASSLTRFANSFIHQNVTDDAISIDLQVAVDGRLARGTTTATDDRAIDGLIARVMAAAATSPVVEDFPGFSPPAPGPDLDHRDPATADATPLQRAEVVESFVTAGDGLSAAGYCETLEICGAYGNTEGQSLEGGVTRAIVDGIHQTSTSAGKGHQASIRLGDLDGEAAGATAAAKARASEEAFDLKPGHYEVVLEPNAVGTIAIFLSYYGFNGLAVAEGRSFATIGEAPFDPTFSLASDPLHADAVGFPFDPEGTPAQRTEFVREGAIIGHAHDRFTAARAGATSTGHAGSGADRRYGPIASNLFVSPGSASREEMIAGVERGLLVTEFNYCRVLDPRTVAMTGLTRNGTFMVENGAVTGAVTNLRFTQSILEALAPGKVAAIESFVTLSDNDLSPGMTHVPTMQLREWNFTGGAGG